jgi:muramoyltetrapeptide carboxypeptidase
MVMEKVKEYDYPVCFDFPVGHIKENYALKCGMKHEMKVANEGTILTCID